MSSRALTSLLVIPSALRPVLLQAALTTSSPAGPWLVTPTATGTSRSQTRPYSRNASSRNSASSKKTTPRSTSSKRTPTRHTSSKKTPSRPTSSKKTPPRPTPSKQTPPHAVSSKQNAFSQPQQEASQSDHGPPRSLSFYPTPPHAAPPIVATLTTDTSAEDLTRASYLFRNPKFLYSAPRFLHLPINTLMPEICILGRSNVGKSTLINALAGLGGKQAGSSHGAKNNRKGIAITSAKAGCTKTMNAYGFGPPLGVKPQTRAEQDSRKEGGRARSERRSREGIKTEPMPKHSLVLMDMPGYGLNSQEDWGQEILKYLTRRDILRGAILLIDAIAGVKTGDRMVLEVLRDAGLHTSVVLTKADKLVSSTDPAAWYGSAALRESCLHVWEEMRIVEKRGADTDWFEGDGWNPEIFVTGAGDPKLGGIGVDGARLAICRLAGHIAEQTRKATAPQPEVVPFDQLVFAPSSAEPIYTPDPIYAPEPVMAKRTAHVGRGRRLKPSKAAAKADPMEQMMQAIERPRSRKQFGRASF